MSFTGPGSGDGSFTLPGGNEGAIFDHILLTVHNVTDATQEPPTANGGGLFGGANPTTDVEVTTTDATRRMKWSYDSTLGTWKAVELA